MHVQIVNFRLRDLSDADYRSMCDDFAPAFAEVPGLVSKTWLANEATNTYGGVYVWESREAMERFAKSELFNAVATNRNLAEMRSTDFELLEGPTRVTNGLVEVAA